MNDLRSTRFQGIVEVMSDAGHREREESLGLALRRLSAAREARGPVGVVDPFEIVTPQERLDVAQPQHTRRREGLFSFARRARAYESE